MEPLLLKLQWLLELSASTSNTHFKSISTEWIDSLAFRLISHFVSTDPNAQAAAKTMSAGLYQALRSDYRLASLAIILSLATLLISVLIPLAYKLISRPRLKIFISFNRTREDVSENLQKQLANAGARAFRLPFQESPKHQDIISRATKGIKSCDSFVCLPGYLQSYVDHEVLAATTSEKPIVFLISEQLGTLPNTADKRYPVFRLESTIKEQFKPLIEFLSYIGADFRSTWRLCLRAFNPYMQISTDVALSSGGVFLSSLWALCYYRSAASGLKLANSVPSFDAIKAPVVLTHLVLLVIVVSIAFLSVSYSCIFCSNLIQQFRARNRARLRTIAVQFSRDDWIDVIPGLRPGAHLYECLFEAAPSAHHEKESMLEQAQHGAAREGECVN
jgi:hypothetical protein